MTRNGCPLCGTGEHACGQPFTGTPFDLPRTETRVMGKVQRYRVTVNGTATTLKLTAEDAKKYKDAELVDTVASVDSDELAAENDDASDGEKAAKPANKARTVQNKGRASGATGDK